MKNIEIANKLASLPGSWWFDADKGSDIVTFYYELEPLPRVSFATTRLEIETVKADPADYIMNQLINKLKEFIQTLGDENEENDN